MLLRRLVGLVLISGLVGFAPAPLPRLKPEALILQQLQGRWTVRAVERDPEQGGRSPFRVNQSLRIENDRILSDRDLLLRPSKKGQGRGRGKSKGPGFPGSGFTMVLNLRETVPQIDLHLGDRRGATRFKGIFHLDGNILRICLSQTSQEHTRPTTFVPPPMNAFVIVLRKEGP